MATNEILQFASTNTGTNLLTQAEYEADAQRTTGHQPGIARSKLENKALRQASLIAAGLAEFIADYQVNNVTDSLTPQNIADYLLNAITSSFPTASTTVQGKVELATTAETQAGTDAIRAITALGATATFAKLLTNIIAGNGLTGGGTLASDRTIHLGTPGTITGTSTNAVSEDSHTHAIQGAWYDQAGVLPIATPEMAQAGTSQNSIVTPWTLNGFPRSMTANGYIRIPGFCIIQWATVDAINGAGGNIRNFPITFPNYCWGMAAVDSGPTCFSIGMSPVNSSQFNMWAREPGSGAYNNATIRYIAIGS